MFWKHICWNNPPSYRAIKKTVRISAFWDFSLPKFQYCVIFEMVLRLVLLLPKGIELFECEVIEGEVRTQRKICGASTIVYIVYREKKKCLAFLYFCRSKLNTGLLLFLFRWKTKVTCGSTWFSELNINWNPARFKLSQLLTLDHKLFRELHLLFLPKCLTFKCSKS